MTKRSVLEREKKRDLLCKRFSHKRSALRTLRNDKSISMQERLQVQERLNAMKRDTSIVRKRNRCSITARPRGYYRKFGISRIQLRVLAGWGMLPGVLKASW